MLENAFSVAVASPLLPISHLKARLCVHFGVFALMLRYVHLDSDGSIATGVSIVIVIVIALLHLHLLEVAVGLAGATHRLALLANDTLGSFGGRLVVVFVVVVIIVIIIVVDGRNDDLGELVADELKAELGDGVSEVSTSAFISVPCSTRVLYRTYPLR